MPLASTFGAVTARAYGFLSNALRIDEFFEYVSLLLPGNGTNGAQNNTFLDSSTNAFSITRNGNTTQGTFSPFSQTGWGNYFSSGGYLSGPSNSAFAVGTGDFTLEFWTFLNAVNVNQCFYDASLAGQSAARNDAFTVGMNTSGQLYFYTASTTNIASAAPQINTWAHIAVSRSGTSLRMFLNGVQVLSLTNSTDFSRTGYLISTITETLGAYTVNGHISNLRLVKGTALYTSAFTPPTTPLTAITNTSLLTCQSNRFIDNSTNNFEITRNGDVSVQAFSPFNPTAAWSAATNGGSGYFDGSGDYLTAPSNAAFNISTGNYTFECWVYKQTSSRVMLVAVASAGLSIAINASGDIEVCRSLTGIDFTFTAGVTNNQWTHIAVSRSATDLRAFMNGVLLGTQTSSTSYGQGICYIGIDADGASTPYFGYITDARLVKGTAVYTSTFTPPTAPLTAIANTSLLLNYTNAGIYDAAAKNDLETVGNAQISTTQSKWGGSSMYFDGTGDWLLGAQNENLSANSDFTVEVWGYIVSGSQTIATYANTSGQTQWRLRVVGGKAEFEWVNNTPTVFAATGTSTLATGQWIYLAATLSGTTLRIFVNGTLEASTTVSGTARNQANPAFFVGQDGIGASNFNGYLQDLRITKGVARYTSNFTPPTAPFPVR